MTGQNDQTRRGPASAGTAGYAPPPHEAVELIEALVRRLEVTCEAANEAGAEPQPDGVTGMVLSDARAYIDAYAAWVHEQTSGPVTVVPERLLCVDDMGAAPHLTKGRHYWGYAAGADFVAVDGVTYDRQRFE